MHSVIGCSKSVDKKNLENMNIAAGTILTKAPASPFFPIVQWMNTRATYRLSSRINAHLSSNKVIDPHRMPRTISKFITHYPWSVQHKAGSRRISMHNTVAARLINVSWDIINSPSSNFVKVCFIRICFLWKL